MGKNGLTVFKNPMPFLNRIRQTINDYNLIRNGDAIVVGVSGGADSTALLTILHSWQPTMGLKIIAAHIHHGLRKNADTDQEFVKNFCAQKQIPYETIRVRLVRKPSESIEEVARKKRFNALIAIAKKYHADSIALAHHQDDIAETVLMRIIRGTGLQGLQAILPNRIIEGMRFIRPFVHVNRKDIEIFLRKKNVPFRVDETNTDTQFLRNHIRHQLLPILKKKYNPNITSSLSWLAQTAGTDYDFLATTGEKAFHDAAASITKEKISLRISDLTRFHPSILRSVLRIAILKLKGNTRAITFDHIRQIEFLLTKTAPVNTRLHLPTHLCVVKTKTKLHIHHRKE